MTRFIYKCLQGREFDLLIPSPLTRGSKLNDIIWIWPCRRQSCSSPWGSTYESRLVELSLPCMPGSFVTYQGPRGWCRTAFGTRPKGRCEAVHSQCPWVVSLRRLCERNEGNFTREKRKKEGIEYLLNYSFAPGKAFRFVLNMNKSIRVTLLHIQELWGCTASHLSAKHHKMSPKLLFLSSGVDCIMDHLSCVS